MPPRQPLPAQSRSLQEPPVVPAATTLPTQPLRKAPANVGAPAVLNGARPASNGSRPGTPHSGPVPLPVVLVDDNRPAREVLASMIRGEPGLTVLADSPDIAGAILKVRQSGPAVVLVDVGCTDHDRPGLIRTAREAAPEARVIIMGLPPAGEDVADFVRAGASGFIMKDASFEEFLLTIRCVAAGQEVLPEALTGALFARLVEEVPATGPAECEGVSLTSRERQVIGLLAEGLSNREIATRLCVAIHTVKSHVHKVLGKLALHSRLEVAAFTYAHAWPRSAATGK